MMFWIAKIVGALLKPLLIVVGVALLGVWLAAATRFRRLGLMLAGLATLGLALMSWWPVAHSVITPLESTYPTLTADQLPDSVSMIVVLGGGGVDNTRVPITAQLGQVTLQRLVEGIRLWRQRPSALLVTSGALPQGRSQASIAADLAEQLGVPRAQIRQLPESRNTEEEAEAFAELLGDPAHVVGLGVPILVTSASHMPRAMAAFAAVGVQPLAAPTGHYAVPQPLNSPSDFTLSADSLRTIEAAWHEYLGQAWARLRAAFNRE